MCSYFSISKAAAELKWKEANMKLKAIRKENAKADAANLRDEVWDSFMVYPIILCFIRGLKFSRYGEHGPKSFSIQPNATVNLQNSMF